MVNTMKRLVCIVLVFVMVLATSIVCASAENFASIAMKPFSGVYKKGSQFTIRIYVCDITNRNGLELAEYHVHYDSENIKYIDSDGGKPAAWNFEDQTLAELWLQNDEATSTFIFAVLNPTTGVGVKKDEEIYLDLTFELLSDIESTTFKVTDILFTDDDLVDCMLDDKEFTISFTGEQSPSQSGDGAGNSQGENQPGESDASSTTTDADPNKTLKIILIVSAAVLLVAAACVAFVLIRKKKS